MLFPFHYCIKYYIWNQHVFRNACCVVKLLDQNSLKVNARGEKAFTPD